VTTSVAAPDSIGTESAGAIVSSVGKGGAVNLFGALIYGAANFALLIVLTHKYGVAPAGVILVAIAIFNICLNFAQLGCSTGFIRWMARHRALDRQDLLRATLWIGIVPVLAIGIVLGGVMWLTAQPLARLFSDDAHAAAITAILRAMAPFLPLSAVYNVVVQGTRGFDTMMPQMVIEKVARAVTLPVIAYLAAVAGIGTEGFGALWAATNLVALVPAWIVFYRLITTATEQAGREHSPADRVLFRDFWGFTAPRAVGQVSEVVVNWLDTVLIGGLVSTRAAGIYGSGTRYLLPGQFTADALMQVSGSRISGLLSINRTREAQALLRITTAWQTMLTWPLYLLIAFYARPLLRVFGAQVVEAQVALIALALSLLVISLVGPVPAIILMSGRSRQAMFNTLVLVVVNVAGNVILVPRYGLNAAGVVWAVTIVIASAMPAWQSFQHLGITTSGPASWRVAGAATATVGVACIVIRIVVGPTVPGLLAAMFLGGIPYTFLVWRMREQLHLPVLLQGFSGRRHAPDDGNASSATTSRGTS
jgi:O-antigen/teichoic acid export membrane protein